MLVVVIGLSGMRLFSVRLLLSQARCQAQRRYRQRRWHGTLLHLESTCRLDELNYCIHHETISNAGIIVDFCFHGRKGINKCIHHQYDIKITLLRLSCVLTKRRRERINKTGRIWDEMNEAQRRNECGNEKEMKTKRGLQTRERVQRDPNKTSINRKV